MRSRLATLGVVVFITYAYFYQAGGWNQNTRFDLVRAIVEQGSLRIDDYQHNTGDLARSGGHAYSDKAPGSSLTAVPAVAIVRLALRAVGRTGTSPEELSAFSYVAALAAAALPATVACLCLFGLARRMGATENVAALATLSYAFATPLWAYATLFWGHALTAGCLMVALLASDLLRDDPSNRARDGALGAVVGLSLGWAVVNEYPSAIAAVVIAALTLLRAWRQARHRFASVTVPLAIAAGCCAVVLLTYQWAAFGSPWQVAYAGEENPTLLQAGFFGITTPRLDVMGELLWGAYRGLLPLAPVLVVAPIGFWWLIRTSQLRWTATAAAACAVCYFLLNSAYEHWEGGMAYGPRHLGAVLGFVCLGIVPVLMRGGRFTRVVVIVLSLVGASCSLVAVSTTPQLIGTANVTPPIDFANPMAQLLWPSFRDGNLAINPQSILKPLPLGLRGPSWNLGQKLGLSGKTSLLPLFLAWGLGALAWRWRSPPPEDVASTGPRSRRRGKAAGRGRPSAKSK